MNIFQAILLSLIEGLTEFLPVSSTGHLILAAQFLGIAQSEFVKSFEIFIQLGAICAVILVYTRKVISQPRSILPVFAAFVPTAILGFVAYPFIKTVLFESPRVIATALLLGGFVLLFVERAIKQHEKTILTLGLVRAAIIGFVQCFSFVPGVSRAAATIVGGLMVGLSKQQAIEFSFLLAIPTILAASGLDLIQAGFHFSSDELVLLSIGFIGSFIAALVVIKWFLKFIGSHSFVGFGIYRIAISIIFFLVS